MSIQGHFIASTQGRIFVSQFGNTKSDVAVLCAPPVAEELNLSRAVLAKQCQAFAQQGLDSFILDYFGTGDSEGEFEEGSLTDWCEDILSVGKWLQSLGYQKLIVLGVRVGALLLGVNQQKLHAQLPIIGQILWKPVTNGKVFASQLIRIKQANQMMSNSTEKVNWRNEILAGNNTEVAGYVLTKAFIEGIEAAVVPATVEWQSPVSWLELATEKVTPATRKFVEASDVIAVHTLQTPAFWQVPEVFDLPELSAVGVTITNKLLGE
ncbi:hypothetical protein DXX93_00700 [Thalassotalea euphylliae]|uniref:Hydrolase 2, exosortase A system-associated n=1 Tax=Thalassotalea euphylliae TaxID=1655234 RepID=A0A3E0TKX7_9GAMM|nr:hypothetical protein [Thalassotalea euphylliae]REL25219.1 hypothetical protein DXX93_00700 [Thalassotalea euphylliae]